MQSVLSTPTPRHTGSAPWRGLRSLYALGTDAVKFVDRIHAESGDVAWFQIGRLRAVLLNRPDLAQAVLVDKASSFHKLGYVRLFLTPVLGQGLLTSEGDLHRRQRKFMAPAFTHARIAAYAATVAEYATTWPQRWVDGQTVDLRDEMMTLTLCIVGKVLFDTDLRTDANEVGHAVGELIRLTDKRANAMVPIPPSWPTLSNRRFAAAKARLDQLIYRMLSQRRSAATDRGDFLSMLLATHDEDGGGMGDQQVRDEAMTLLVAGHETTANALTWAWLLLCEHPDVYARWQDELDAVLGDRPPGPADLPQLPYTLQILKEAMRLYPPAWILGRSSLEDLDVAGLAIPSDTEVLISTYLLHRRTDVFPEPDRFWPERFAANSEATLPRCAYLPFGLGPRVCIGNHFATLEGHLVLASLGQQIRFSRPGGLPRPHGLVTLRPRGSVPATVQHRRKR